MVRNFSKIFAVFTLALMLGGCGSPINVNYKGPALRSALGVLGATQIPAGGTVTITFSNAVGAHAVVSSSRFAASSQGVNVWVKHEDEVDKIADATISADGLTVTFKVTGLAPGTYSTFLQLSGDERAVLQKVDANTGKPVDSRFTVLESPSDGSTTGGSTTGGSESQAPSITSLSPASAAAGATFSIIGLRFIPGTSEVHMNSTTTLSGCSVTSTTRIDGCVVPNSLAPNTYAVTVLNGTTASAGSNFTITVSSGGAGAPIVMTLSPPSGISGSYFSIDGSNFIQGTTTFTMGNVTITCFMISANSASGCTVPSLAPGSYAVVATNGSSPSNNNVLYTLTGGGGPPAP